MRADAEINFVKLQWDSEHNEFFEKEIPNGVFKLRENLSSTSDN